ncbi:MAG: hypothetical protein C3F10_12835 [Dehalococcoidia bacterium]|nr:MAG: hypothetical protein C3F10_12835 [Dehalococcoidia bacterium]
MASGDRRYEGWAGWLGTWLFLGLFQSAGLPTKRGLFGQQEIPGAALQAAAHFSFQISMGIGAFQPDSARRAIAFHFADPSAQRSRAAVDSFIVREMGRMQSDMSKFPGLFPWEACALQTWEPYFGKRRMSWRDIAAPSTQEGMTGIALAGLAWGVQHGDGVLDLIHAARAHPRTQFADGWATDADYRQDCRTLMADWLAGCRIELPVLEGA